MAALGPHPDAVSSPIDGAAEEKHPINYTNEVDPAEIPSPASCEVVTGWTCGDTESSKAHVAAYHYLLYNILRKSKRDGCPAMPAGLTHLGRDRVALPVHRKRDTPA